MNQHTLPIIERRFRSLAGLAALVPTALAVPALAGPVEEHLALAPSAVAGNLRRAASLNAADLRYLPPLWHRTEPATVQRLVSTDPTRPGQEAPSAQAVSTS